MSRCIIYIALCVYLLVCVIRKRKKLIKIIYMYVYIYKYIIIKQYWNDNIRKVDGLQKIQYKNLVVFIGKNPVTFQNLLRQYTDQSQKIVPNY